MKHTIAILLNGTEVFRREYESPSLDGAIDSAFCDAEETGAVPANWETGVVHEVIAPLETAPVEKIKKGEFVRRMINGVPSKKTYQRGEYCGESKRYNLRDCDDIYGPGLNVKKGTLLHIGFTY